MKLYKAPPLFSQLGVVLQQIYAAEMMISCLRFNPCPAEPGYTLPLQTV